MKEGIGRIDLSDLDERHYKSMTPIRAKDEAIGYVDSVSLEEVISEFFTPCVDCSELCTDLYGEDYDDQELGEYQVLEVNE